MSAFGHLAKHWGRFDSASSFVGWLWWMFLLLSGLSGAAVTGWLASQWAYFWNTIGWFGVWSVALISWFLIAVGLNCYRLLAPRSQSATKSVALDEVVLKEKFVYAGSVVSALPPRFRATSAINARNIRIFVDESHFIPSIGSGGWSPRKRILITELAQLSRDEIVDVALLVPYENNGAKLWRWGCEPETPPSGDYVYWNNGTYRGRVVVTNDNGEEEYCYFFAEGLESDAARAGEAALPRLRGSHLYDIASQWESEK